MLLFFITNVFCSNILKTLEPNQMITFYEVVSSEDQYCDLFLSKTSQSEDVFYRIFPPNTKKLREIEFKESQEAEFSEENESLEFPLERNVNKKLDREGIWTIQLYNRGNNQEKFVISSHPVKKIIKGNEDVTALRNLLNLLQNSVETLGNENYYAKNIQMANIEEARRIKKTLNWLLIFPLLTFGIAYGKYSLARQLVRPKGKRFKGLF